VEEIRQDHGQGDVDHSSTDSALPGSQDTGRLTEREYEAAKQRARELAKERGISVMDALEIVSTAAFDECWRRYYAKPRGVSFQPPDLRKWQPMGREAT